MIINQYRIIFLTEEKTFHFGGFQHSIPLGGECGASEATVLSKK
jgi:hypothetical protein